MKTSRPKTQMARLASYSTSSGSASGCLMSGSLRDGHLASTECDLAELVEDVCQFLVVAVLGEDKGREFTGHFWRYRVASGSGNF